MKRKHLLPAAAAFLLLTGCTGRQSEAVHSRDLFAMDTYMNLKAYGTHADSALDAASARITELETMLSVTDAGSEIWAANHAGGTAVPVSEDTARILHMAEQVAAESKNALSVSIYPVLRAWGFTTGSYQVPSDDELTELLTHTGDARITLEEQMLTVPEDMEIDLGALVKGYTSDAVMEILRESGVSSAIVSLGGNVQAMGLKPDGSRWTVGITNPFDPDQNVCTVQIADAAVITSGNYERFFLDDAGNAYWHIIDPADGCPADNGLVSVTVIGESGLRCDALSTALFVEGTQQAAEHWRQCDDFEMICVTDDAKLWVTEGIADVFENLSEMPVEVLRK